MKRLLLASFLLSSMTMNAQNMENALTPRRQGLAVIAALEAKGDQPGASNEWLEPVTDEQYKRVREDSRSTF